MEFTFGILFQIFTIAMFCSYFLDNSREECRSDVRFNKMSQVAQVIMFLVGLHSLFQLVIAIIVGRKTCRANQRRKLDPPVLSSDEEDDAEFLV